MQVVETHCATEPRSNPCSIQHEQIDRGDGCEISVDLGQLDAGGVSMFNKYHYDRRGSVGGARGPIRSHSDDSISLLRSDDAGHRVGDLQ